MRIENLTVDDLEALLDDVQRRSHVATAVVVGVAAVVGACAEAAPGAGFVAVVVASVVVFALSRSEFLPRLQPLTAACRDAGLDDDAAARVAAHVDVPLLWGTRDRARALARALRAGAA